MTKHTTTHPLANQPVQVRFTADKRGETAPPELAAQYENGEAIYQADYLEDWWDHLTGVSWMDSNGNFAALKYAMRAGFASLPVDDEVVYVKINNLGHLIHTSELVLTKEQEELVEASLYADGTVDPGM